MRASGEKYDGHGQAAMARWIRVACAETPIISLPRQATGLT